MARPFRLWSMIIGLGMMALLFQNCGRPSKLPGQSDLLSKSGTPDFEALSAAIFAPKCAGCHAGFATYEDMMASGAVVPKSPEQSGVYTRTASGAMPKGGPPLSDVEVKAIYNWIAAGAPKSNGGGSGGSIDSGSGSAPPDGGAPAITPTFAWVQAAVLTPRCLICHRGASAPAGYDLSSYDSVMTGGRIVAGNPSMSRFFQRIDNGSMPPGGPALSNEQKQAIAQWIQNGAKNDAPAGGVTPGPTPPPLPPLEPKFASIQANILNSRCVGCHNGTTTSGGVRLDSYNAVRREVVAGNALRSTLYEVLEDNEMPAAGGPLSFEQKQTIRQWIDAGALNN